MQRHLKPPPTNLAGFTLIELMVTVAVVAILGTIAMASYSSQIQKSRRTDARTAILDLAGREERLFSATNAYSATPSDLGYAGVWPITVGSGYYQVTVTNPTPTSYVITANTFGSQLNVRPALCSVGMSWVRKPPPQRLTRRLAGEIKIALIVD